MALGFKFTLRDELRMERAIIASIRRMKQLTRPPYNPNAPAPLPK